MPRIRRRLALIAKALCVAVFLALLVITLISYQHTIVLGFTPREVHALKFQSGVVQYWNGQNNKVEDAESPKRVIAAGLPWTAPMGIDLPADAGTLPVAEPLETVRTRRVLVDVWPPFSQYGGIGTAAMYTVDASGRPTSIWLGRWFIVRAASSWLFVSPPGLLSLWIFYNAIKRARYRPGHCPACGYDLRATPDRCPECGAVPGAAIAPQK